MGADTGVSKEPWGCLTGLSQPRTKSMNSVIRFVGRPGPPLMVAPFPLLWHSYVFSALPSSTKAFAQKSLEQIPSHKGLIGYFLRLVSFLQETKPEELFYYIIIT